MKKYFVLSRFAFAAIAFVAPRAFAKGSLAIGHGEAYGWAINLHSYDESDGAALEHCGRDCKVVYRFENTCAAYAKDASPGVSHRLGPRRNPRGEAEHLVSAKNAASATWRPCIARSASGAATII